MAFNLITKIWQTGSLDWWGRIDGRDLYLGRREFPLPPTEGDEWQVAATGAVFRIEKGAVRCVQPPHGESGQEGQ